MPVDTSALEAQAGNYYLAVGAAVADQIVDELRRAAPPGIRNDIHATVRGLGGSMVAIDIVADSEDAAFTNRGVRPHKITAHGRALSITVGGVRYAAKSVQHPGTKGSRWWDNTLAHVSDIVRRALA